MTDDSERLDSWLHRVMIIKRRTVAKELADSGHIWIDRTVAKPAHEVKVGNRITIGTGGRRQTYEVLGIPHGNVSKERAIEYYRVIGQE